MKMLKAISTELLYGCILLGLILFMLSFDDEPAKLTNPSPGLWPFEPIHLQTEWLIMFIVGYFVYCRWEVRKFKQQKEKYKLYGPLKS